MTHEFKGYVGHASDSTLMWYHRITVPDDIFVDFKATDKRVICTVNNSNEHHCALMSNGDGTFYIMLNNDFRKKIGIDTGDEVIVKLRKDDSRYGMVVPLFFEDLCHQDSEASDFFHALTPGKQRSLLHIIGKLKSEEKQLEKALIIFDHLKSRFGELDFKILNEDFKSNRFKK